MGFLEPSNLITNPTVKQDFYKINPAYYGRSYKYGHLTQNVFALSMELWSSSTWTLMRSLELPDGFFPTEPIFVADPNGTEEDDAVILMSGVDGGKEIA